MAVNLTYPHIEKPKDEPARLERLPRIRVAQIVMDHLAHGWSAEEMCRQHPHLELAEVYAALGYYCDHRQEIDAEIEQEWAEARQARDQAQPSPLALRLRAGGLL